MGRADTLTDFSVRGGDLIVLSRLDADRDQDGNQDFAFIGGRKFSGDAGELRAFRQDGNTYIRGDNDGDRKADFAIILDYPLRLGADDFIL